MTKIIKKTEKDKGFNPIKAFFYGI